MRSRQTLSEPFWSGPPSLLPSAAPDRGLGAERADLTYTVVLFVLALAIRLLVVLLWAREPVWDGHYYHFGAERLAAGLGYSEDVIFHGAKVWKPWAHYPVGYSAFLAAFYWLFGASTLTAPLVGAVVGAGLAALTHRFARYFLPTNRARIAGGLCALHPGLIAYSALVMTEPLAAALALGSGLCAVRLRHHRWGGALAGTLLGLGALVRPSSLFFLPALLLAFGRPRKRAALQTLIALGFALLTILPWTARNCRVMDSCALISTNGGWNLAIGALTETGRFQTLRADDGCPVVTGQVQQDRCWADVGWKAIQSAPLAWLAKAPLKLSQTFDHESFAVEYLHEAAPELWPDSRRQAGRDLLTFFHRALIALSALAPVALITARGRRASLLVQGALLLMVAAAASYCAVSDEHPFFLLIVASPLLALVPRWGAPTSGPAGSYLYGLVFLTALTHAVFFGDDRYHMVISPVLCILAAAACRTHTGLLGPQRGPAEVLSER